MQSHEVLREVFEKCSPKQIAADLDLSLSLVYKWAEPPDADGPPTGNPLERVAALYRCSHDEKILQWLCQQAGGFFIRNPKTHLAHPDYLIPATNQIVQEFADLLAVIATAAADNQISAEGSEDDSRALGGAEVGDGNICGVLRAREFRALEGDATFAGQELEAVSISQDYRSATASAFFLLRPFPRLLIVIVIRNLNRLIGSDGDYDYD